MDSIDVISFARALIDIDSTTGREAEAVRVVEDRLVHLGYRLERQPVEGDRYNLFASDRPPSVIFSTHVDCVPPHIPSSECDGLLFGRGACDAKGTLAAQTAAAERLRSRGRRDIGLLFVVGEERGSDGARVAGRSAPKATGPRFLVNGEPTENKLATSTRGILRVRLKARGRAAHSSFPETGESAIEKLVSALVALRQIELPADPEVGRTFYTVGLIHGGVAPNVVPAEAEAELLFRTVGDAGDLRRTLRGSLREVELEEVLEAPPVKFDPVEGFETASFPYTTDVPLLRTWGMPLLLGPGDPRVAHTDAEHAPISELRRAVDLYVALAEALAGR